MKSRSEALFQLRPNLNLATSPLQNPLEHFQNTCLRPILKFQNELLLEVFKMHIRRRKNLFYSLKKEDRPTYISNEINKDNQLRKLLQGITLALFTLEEMDFYQENKSEVNKRINRLIAQRLIDQLQLLEA